MKSITWGYTQHGNRRHVITEQYEFTSLCWSHLVDKIRPELLKDWVPCRYCVLQAGLCEHCVERPADKGRVEDPYLAELSEEYVKSWYCSECYDDSLGDI